jgi:type II secretory pathway component PulC
VQAGGKVDEERLTPVDAAEDSRERELRLALLDFAVALEAAAAAARRPLGAARIAAALRAVAPSARRLPRAPQITAALLGVAIVVQAADVANSIVREVRQRLPDASSAAARRVMQPPVQLDPRVSELFGSRVADTAVESAATDATLVLTGVIAADDPGRGFGILGTAREHTAVYPAGASLPGAARLIAVYADRVELERAGVREVLRLPRAALTGTALVARVELAALATAETPPVTAGPEAMPDSTAAAQHWINHYLGWEARGTDGRVIGVHLAVRRRDGIEAGDILTAINGVPVTRDNAAQLLGRDGEGQPLALTVLRNGKSIVMDAPAP